VKLPAPAKGAPARLARAMRADAAYQAVVRAGLAHLRANERGMLGRPDPEYLHQMRVALRRLRAAISAFTPAPDGAAERMRSELKWISRELGAARDWDVFVGETLPRMEAELRTRLPRTRARSATLRGQARSRARRAVRSPRYRDLVRSLADACSARRAAGTASLVQPGLDDYAPAVLDWRYRRLIRAAGRPGKLSPRALHRFRIELKKFRYAAYFFSGLFPPRAERVAMKRLSQLQDILGSINDAAVTVDLAARACAGARRPGPRDEQRQMLAWKRRRIETLQRELAGAWRQFREGGRYWQDRNPG